MNAHTVSSPWVAGLLRSTALQLLHQHLAAPSQSVTNLPEGAAATQRPVTILKRENRTELEFGLEFVRLKRLQLQAPELLLNS